MLRKHNPGCPCCECVWEGAACGSFCKFIGISNHSDIEWEADLGAGGWTDDACNNCTSISGKYILISEGAGCIWSYNENPLCSPLDSPYGDCGVRLSISLGIITAGVPGGWRYLSDVRLHTFCIDDPPPCGCPSAQLIAYRSSIIPFRPVEECPDCSEPLDGNNEMVLSKHVDATGDICGGTLPATITMKRLAA